MSTFAEHLPLIEETEGVEETRVARWRFDQFLASNAEGVIGWRAGKNLRTT